MQDECIVELYFKRDEAALSETKKKYENYLMKIAYNVLSDTEDSRESVNSTYFAAWNTIPPKRPNFLSTYLGKITRRISIDMFRKKTSIKRISSEYSVSLSELSDCVQSNSDNPEDMYDEKDLADAISRFLRTLSPEARNAFIGRYYFMDSLSQVAEYCKMSESKAKSMLFRTRLKLKEFLIEEGFVL